MGVAEMRRMFRVKRSDFWIALAAIPGPCPSARSLES